MNKKFQKTFFATPAVIHTQGARGLQKHPNTHFCAPTMPLLSAHLMGHIGWQNNRILHQSRNLTLLVPRRLIDEFAYPLFLNRIGVGCSLGYHLADFSPRGTLVALLQIVPTSLTQSLHSPDILIYNLSFEVTNGHRHRNIFKKVFHSLVVFSSQRYLFL